MPRKVLARLALVLSVGGAITLAAACGTDAVGIEACRTIETARCKQAPNCPNFSLGQPVHAGTDVTACILFYDDACLHGLAAADPGAVRVGECLTAITTGTCDIVESPEHDIRCAWLVPTPTPDAAAADTGDGDAPGETGSDAAATAD